jgi:hypothetical protein
MKGGRKENRAEGGSSSHIARLSLPAELMVREVGAWTERAQLSAHRPSGCLGDVMKPRSERILTLSGLVPRRRARPGSG